jgi:hypothetical protein
MYVVEFLKLTHQLCYCQHHILEKGKHDTSSRVGFFNICCNWYQLSLHYLNSWILHIKYALKMIGKRYQILCVSNNPYVSVDLQDMAIKCVEFRLRGKTGLNDKKVESCLSLGHLADSRSVRVQRGTFSRFCKSTTYFSSTPEYSRIYYY